MVFSKNKHKLTPGRRTLPGVVFITIISCFCLIRSPVLAQDLTATPSATILPSPAAESPAPSLSPTQIPTGPATASPTAEPRPVTATPYPTTAVTQTSSVSTVQTATATGSATLDVFTAVNTTASGAQPAVINYTQPSVGTIDLTGSGACNATSSAQLQALINNVMINNTVNMAALEGSGTASAKANVFNMANTTLSGACWNFLVLNFFAPHTGNVVLPSYQTYIKPSASAMTVANVPAVSNTVNVTDVLNATAKTGSVDTTNIQTGNATVTINAQNVLNTTLVGNNWLFLAIRSYGNWNGTLLNWPGPMVQTPGYLYTYLPLTPGNSAGTLSVMNNAQITNDISVAAGTGNHDMTGSIRTGSAMATVNLFNFINTTLVGNNWYFAYISLFDSFAGNFLFPEVASSVITVNPIQSATPVPEQAGTAAVTQPAIITDIPKITAQPTIVYNTAEHASVAQPTFLPVAATAHQPPIHPADPPAETAGYFISSSAFIGIIIKRYVSLRRAVI